MSGYAHCACRDCFETIVANNPARPELCDGCREAGCGDPAATGWPECQREDAYGAEEEPEEYIYRPYHRRDCPTPWFHSNAGHVCPDGDA